MKVTPNVYYSPEAAGLSIFDQIDTAGSYEFDIFLILEDENKMLYYCSDSGCSCPTPFEAVTEIHEITFDTLFNFEQALENHSGISQSDFLNMRKRVKDHLNNNMGKVINNASDFFYNYDEL